jgi:hypothetical protein
MSIGASPAPPVADDGLTGAVEVEVRGRWDALALYELLGLSSRDRAPLAEEASE